MTGRHKAALIIFGLGIAFMIFAMLMWKWGIPQLTGYFVLIAILIGIASRLRPGQIADGFVDGARQLLFAALLVGFARTAQIVLEQGQVLTDWREIRKRRGIDERDLRFGVMQSIFQRVGTEQER